MKTTPRKILDAAEKLFAKQGVEATSVREIGALAGTSHGVLHYHFGSREAVLKAILERRMPPLMAERMKLLAALESKQEPVTVREVLEVLALPLARLMIEGGPSGRRTVQLMARLFADNNPIHLQESSKHFKGMTKSLVDHCRVSLPDLSEAELELRMGIAAATIFAVLAKLDQPARPWQTHLETEQLTPTEVVRRMLDFLERGFCGQLHR